MPIDAIEDHTIKPNSHTSTCRKCGLKASHISSSNLYQDEYLVTDDGSYDEETNTFICWECYRNNFKKLDTKYTPYK